MLGFELVVRRVILRASWTRIGHDYDLRYGGFLGLGMVVLLLAPWIAAHLRGCLPPSVPGPARDGGRAGG